MDVTLAVECCANRADAPVHHVGGRYDVYTGRSADQRLAFQHGDGFVVQHISGGINDAVLAVRGVRIQRDIGDHAQLRKTFFQRGHCARHQTFGIDGFAPVRCFQCAFNRRKQRNCRNPGLETAVGMAQQLVDGVALHPRHRIHGDSAVFTVDDEHRIDQIIRGQTVFAHQAPRKLVLAHAAHTYSGIFA